MKRILISLIAFCCSQAFSATLLPVQLISPAGSTSGQAIVSTGASSAPVWSNGVNAAQLNGATFASPPASGYGSTTPEPVAATTVTATGLITPTSSIGIKGTVAADNAQAGSIGEHSRSVVTSVGVANATVTNITSVPLSAGDWTCTGNIVFKPAAGTIATTYVASTNTVSVTAAASPLLSVTALTFPAGVQQSLNTPSQRFNVSSAATAFLIGSSAFTVSTMTADGVIDCIRTR